MAADFGADVPVIPQFGQMSTPKNRSQEPEARKKTTSSTSSQRASKHPKSYVGVSTKNHFFSPGASTKIPPMSEESLNIRNDS